MGIVYISIVWRFSDFWHYINGIVIGFTLGLLIALIELFVFSRGTRRLKFIWVFTLRILVYFTLIPVIIFNITAISRMVRWSASYMEVLGNEEFYQGYLIDGDFPVAIVSALILAFLVNFIRMISRKMGQGMLLSYIRGTYYRPVHQARIIMFINVVDSKKLAHELGPHNLHRFLNDLFYDLTDPVISNQGIIYEYIEDLVVITWAIDKGLRNAKCVRTFFDFKKALEFNAEKYLNKYGIVPKIQASLHTGSVVRAEIGEVKTQIVFHGDTMNTTARILSKCNELKTDLLASEQLIRMIGLPRIYEKVSVGDINLRGKQEPLKLFEINDKA